MLTSLMTPRSSLCAAGGEAEPGRGAPQASGCATARKAPALRPARRCAARVQEKAAGARAEGADAAAPPARTAPARGSAGCTRRRRRCQAAAAAARAGSPPGSALLGCSHGRRGGAHACKGAGRGRGHVPARAAAASGRAAHVARCGQARAAERAGRGSLHGRPRSLCAPAACRGVQDGGRLPSGAERVLLWSSRCCCQARRACAPQRGAGAGMRCVRAGHCGCGRGRGLGVQRRLPPGVPRVLRGACTFTIGASVRGVRTWQACTAAHRPQHMVAGVGRTRRASCLLAMRACLPLIGRSTERARACMRQARMPALRPVQHRRRRSRRDRKVLDEVLRALVP